MYKLLKLIMQFGDRTGHLHCVSTTKTHLSDVCMMNAICSPICLYDVRRRFVFFCAWRGECAKVFVDHCFDENNDTAREMRFRRKGFASAMFNDDLELRRGKKGVNGVRCIVARRDALSKLAQLVGFHVACPIRNWVVVHCTKKNVKALFACNVPSYATNVSCGTKRAKIVGSVSITTSYSQLSFSRGCGIFNHIEMHTVSKLCDRRRNHVLCRKISHQIRWWENKNQTGQYDTNFVACHTIATMHLFR